MRGISFSKPTSGVAPGHSGAAPGHADDTVVVVVEPPVEMPQPTDEIDISTPVADEPVAEEPVAEEPVAEEPAVEEPAVEEPSAEETLEDAEEAADEAADLIDELPEEGEVAEDDSLDSLLSRLEQVLSRLGNVESRVAGVLERLNRAQSAAAPTAPTSSAAAAALERFSEALGKIASRVTQVERTQARTPVNQLAKLVVNSLIRMQTSLISRVSAHSTGGHVDSLLSSYRDTDRYLGALLDLSA